MSALQSRALFLASTLALHLNASAASAPEECRAINDNDTRLACYDALFSPLPSEAEVDGARDETLLKQVAEQRPEAAEAVKISRKRKFHYSLFDEEFSIQPYRDSYLLPYTYSSRINREPFVDSSANNAETAELDNQEVKFQISFKIPLAQDLLLRDATLWAGYSQKSLWQMYNSDASAPFRETNYEPEIFWQVATPLELFDISLDSVTLGFNHQSNGRGRELSRSWNRLFAEVALSHNRWSFGVRPWYRIPEDDDSDDNPDIDDYLGYGDFSVSYEWRPDLILKTQLRHNFHDRDSRTSVELGLVFPLPGPLNGYLEYVNGYGETLIDYNYRSKRIGIGVILNEWK